MSKAFVSPIRMLNTLTRYGRVFATVGKAPLIGVITLSSFGALLEGVGISLFFPLLNPESLQGSANTNVAKFIYGIFSVFGADISMRNTLAIMLVFFLAKGSVKFFETRLRGHIVANFQARSQLRIFEKICSLKFEKFQSKNRGSLTNLISTEVQSASQALTEYNQTLTCLATALAYLLFAVALSWRLATAGVICGFVMILIQRPISSRISRGGFQLAKTRKKLGSELFETLSNFKYLRASNAIQIYSQRIISFFEEYREKKIYTSNLDGIWVGINQPLSVLILVSLIYWDSTINGVSVAGSIVSLGIIYRVMGSLNTLQSIWNNFSLNRGHLDYLLKEESDLSKDLETPSEVIPGISWDQDFRTNSLTLYINGNEKILDNVTLKIDQGDFIAIVGQSGSGKSTLLDALIGLHRCDEGKFFFNERPVPASALGSLRQEIGFVAQEVPVFNGTLLQNVAMHRTGGSIDLEWAKTCMKNAEMGFVEQMPDGVNTLIGEGGVTLSGGQKQRLGLAREMYKRPKILFLDEATSALDLENENKLLIHLAKLRTEMKVVLVTHRLASLKETTRIYVLDKGKTAESGTFQELVDSPNSLFSRLLHTEVGSRNSAVRFGLHESMPAWADIIENGEPSFRFRVANISETGVGLFMNIDIPHDKISQGQLLDLSLVLGAEKALVVARVIHHGNGLIGMNFIDTQNPSLRNFLAALVKHQKLSNAA